MYKGHAPVKNIYQLSQEFIATHQKQIEFLVDFGARHGESFESLGHLCDGDYVFIEPNARAAVVIRELIKKLNCEVPRLHLVEGVIAKESGPIELFIFENDSDMSSNLFSDRKGKYGAASKALASAISYDDFHDQFKQYNQIDFAKINIEGGEYQFIADGYFNKISSFVMELHNEHVPNRTWRDALKDLSDNFDVWTHGDLNYKYCYMSGIRCK